MEGAVFCFGGASFPLVQPAIMVTAKAAVDVNAASSLNFLTARSFHVLGREPPRKVTIK